MDCMMTLGDLRAAIAGMEDDLCLSLEFDVMGKTLHCGIESVSRADDPYLGFDEAVFKLCVDPDVIAGDAELMEKLEDRKERLEDYYETFCE